MKMVMEKVFASAALLVLLLSLARCAPAPACRPVTDNQPIAVPAPAPAQAAPVQTAPVAPAPATVEPGYLHASGGAFY
jgi:hypothetical protein